MSGHGMGGLKAQLLLSAQGIALGLSEFVFLPPCKGKSSTDSVVLEKLFRLVVLLPLQGEPSSLNGLTQGDALG